jgi:competence protein ComEA
MDSQEFIKKYSLFLKNNWIALSVGIVGMMLLSYGLIGLLVSSSSSKDIIFEEGDKSSQETSNGSKNSNTKEIMVDVGGAVVSPGVYSLPQDSRIKDALIAAGGLSSTADRDWIAKNLNLAAKVIDAGKLYIPFTGENIRSASSYSSMGNSSVMSGLININSASEKELDSLSGIGPVTAQKIINGRPFQAVEDLLSKKIVSSKVFEQIKNKITVY